MICEDGRVVPVPGGGVYLHNGPTTVAVDIEAISRAAAMKMPGAVRVFLGEGAELTPLARRYLAELPAVVRQRVVVVWPRPAAGATVDLAAVRESAGRFQLPVHVPREPGIALPENLAGVPHLVPVDERGTETSFERATGFRIPPTAAPVSPAPMAAHPQVGRIVSAGQLSVRSGSIQPVLAAAAEAGTRLVAEIGQGALSDSAWRTLVQTSLSYALHGQSSLVLSFEESADANRLARAFGGVKVRPVADGFSESWRAEGPGGRRVELGTTLTAAALTNAGNLAEPPSLRVPPMLTDLLAIDAFDWPAVFVHLEAHRGELTTGLIRDSVQDLSALADALRPDPAPKPRDARPAMDHWLPGLITVLGIAAREHPGAARIEPTARRFGDEEKPVTTGLTLQFALDYLSARSFIANPPHPRLTRMLWDGLLLQAMVGGALSMPDMLALVHGVGTEPADLANAAVFDALAGVLDDPGRLGAGQDLIVANRCDLPDADRLAWVMRMRLLGNQRPDARSYLDSLTSVLNICG